MFLSVCRTYVFMVTLFFVVQVVNNYAFNFNIPMTLHMIFRAVCSFSTMQFCGNSSFTPKA